MKRNDCIARNITHTARAKILVLVFNKFQIKPFFLTTTLDPDYAYDCYIPHVSDKQTEAIQAYVNGIIDTIKSY